MQMLYIALAAGILASIVLPIIKAKSKKKSADPQTIANTSQKEEEYKAILRKGE